MTQGQLAGACRPPVTQQTISKIEHNDICPRDRVKEIIAAALGTSVGELFPWPTRKAS